jgi:pyruvate,water dikinase
LTNSEIRRLVSEDDATLKEELSQLVQNRRSQRARDEQLSAVPPVVYGNEPAPPSPTEEVRSSQPQQLRGIAASSGRTEGRIKVMREFQPSAEIDPQTILVVPHTDAGWAPLLSRAGGLIAEVGGRLSHGAIIARESGIPAVMDVGDATTQLRDGQRVRLDGRSGVVEVLD